MRKRPDYGNATPEDVVRVLMRPTNERPIPLEEAQLAHAVAANPLLKRSLMFAMSS